ncbi:hypothetical protein FACS1894105_01810 [Clostridia bacterium]|nr:hypothetical protein FACS1894105_01810 [Clostridia bacterium]
MKTPKENFDLNIKRVDNLLKIFDATKQTVSKSDDKNKAELEAENFDILRAVVVFLHSAFENYFRTVIIDRLKTDEKLKLPNIGLPNDKTKAEKFYVSQLVGYKDKNVKSLINESIEFYMGKESFSKFEVIASWAEKLCLNIDEFKRNKKNIDTLDEMIKRRHKIVHEADQKQRKNANENNDQLESQSIPKQINRKTVDDWKKVVIQLVDCIEAQLVIRDVGQQIETN